MSNILDDDTDSTEKSDGTWDAQHDSDWNMRKEDDVDTPYGIYWDGDVDME